MEEIDFFKEDRELTVLSNRQARQELSEYGKELFKEPVPYENAASMDLYDHVTKINHKPTNKLTKRGQMLVEKRATL